MAGGFTPVADQKNVRILRRNGDAEQTLTVDVGRMIQRTGAEEVYIEAGDSIVVPKSFF